jgi:hypothetical protein
MHDKLLGVSKRYNDAGLSLPTLLAVLPLIVTALITTKVTFGDTNQAVYIIGELGLIQMWTQGIGALLVTMVPFAITILMLLSLRRGNQQPVMYVAAFFLAILVFFTVNIIWIIFMMILVLIVDPAYENWMDKQLEKEKADTKKESGKLRDELERVKTEKALDTVKEKIERLEREVELSLQKTAGTIRALFFLLGCILLVQIVFSYPTIPTTTLKSKEGRIVTGLVMKRDADRVMIYDQKNKKIEMIYVDNIKTEEVCSNLGSPLRGLAWSPARLLYEYFGWATLPYATCKK